MNEIFLPNAFEKGKVRGLFLSGKISTHLISGHISFTDKTQTQWKN